MNFDTRIILIINGNGAGASHFTFQSVLCVYEKCEINVSINLRLSENWEHFNIENTSSISIFNVES